MEACHFSLDQKVQSLQISAEGITHLLMEGVDLSTHRHLSVYHPIYKLLAPHLLNTMAINKKGRELLLDGGIFDSLMSVGVKGSEHLMAKRIVGLVTWHLDVDGTLPEDLKRRVVCVNIGRRMRYVYDGLKVYEAIKKYVTNYIHLYYSEFITELGVPGGGRFRNLDHLIQTLTSFIVTCSVQHAAVNFPQYNFSGFPPAYPTELAGSPPIDKRPQTMEAVLNALPGVATLTEIIMVGNVLSAKVTNALGDFETMYIQDLKAVQILHEFRVELSEISQLFTASNKQCRVPPYDYLLPENIPNSVSI
ncbi:polyunsaturated fatty acid lipoxygenase ALOX12-like [Haliotis asinina]|uniref:polyunsaturated fatty acid lipoxygenase ALOX12-like n=1 Tax=Haliotis asinina TaxID=109174 RepID=UPI00353234DB